MDVSISHISMQTAALVAKDLRDLVGLTGLNAIKRISKVMSKQQGINQQDLVNAGVSLTAEDFEVSLNKTRMKLADSIGAPKIPKVTWEDIGGLSNVKNDILDTIQLPLEHPELFSSGMKKRSGILLYGPPGTGKTLIAKAIATSFSLNFLSVKGPELLNMYIGESESNVRKIFQKARNARPCVIFFDELDSVAPKRGEKGDSGGVMDRIVSQMLAELDGISSDEVFVIGATNRPDLLDSALLRPGRFDKLLYLGVSESHEMQMRILEALTRKFNLSPNLDLKTISELCPFNYTGADFYALCSDAMLKAMVRTIKFVDKKIEELPPDPNHPVKITPQYYLEQIHPEPIKVQVEHEDFVNALNELVPSVSMDDLNHYRQVREKFESKKESI